MRNFTFVIVTALLSACSSPPKPVTVDASTRRPANSVTTLELQRCLHDLHNTRLRARESDWITESVAVTRQQLATLQQTIAALQPVIAQYPASAMPPDRQAPQPSATTTQQSTDRSNSLYVLRFAHGSSRLDIPVELGIALKQEAREAPLIMLRGRTDGQTDSPAESSVAKARAYAVRDYLVVAGIEPSRIRTTYQAVGDTIADNSGPDGRGLNRRVEIEIYRSPPKVVGAAPAAQKSQHPTEPQ